MYILRHFLIFLFPSLILARSQVSLHKLIISSTYVPDRIDIAHYIPGHINPLCPLVVVSKEAFDFGIVDNRPLIIVSDISQYLPMRGYCGILFAPYLSDIFEQFQEDYAILEFESYMKAILTFVDISKPERIKEIRNFFDISDLVLIDGKTEGKKDITRMSKCKGSHGLKCILRGQLLRVGYSSREPYLTFLNWSQYGENDTIPDIRINRTNSVFKYFSGIEAKVLAALTDEYEMSFDMIAAHALPEDKDPNVKWMGRWGQVYRDEVDMIVGHIVINYDRRELGFFSSTILMQKYTLVSKTPAAIPKWDAPIRPFPLMGWTLLLACIIAVGPAAWGCTKLHRKWTNTNVHKDESILRVSGQAAATLLVEPWLRPPGGPAAIVLIAWFVGCLILQIIYSSNFTAHLSVPAVEKPIDTLRDVLESEATLMTTSTIDLFIKQSKNPEIQKIAAKVIRRVGEHDLFDKLDEGYVAVHDAISVSHLMKKYKKKRRKYYISPRPILTLSCGWLFAEDDGALVVSINQAILRLGEAGLLEKWLDEMIDETGNKQIRHSYETSTTRKYAKALEKKEMPLSFSHLQSVFLLWCVGLGLGLCIFIIENFLRWMAIRRALREKSKLPVFPYLQ